MIEILTPLAEAECRNCGGKITQYRGDLSLGARWSHEQTRTAYCPGAPEAWPIDDTIRDLTTPPATEPCGACEDGCVHGTVDPCPRCRGRLVVPPAGGEG